MAMPDTDPTPQAFETPPAPPDHVWLFALSDLQAHQFPAPVVPDDEGIVVTLCGVEKMAFRVLAEFRPPHCMSCQLLHGARAAEEQEAAGVSADRVMFR